MNATDKSGGVKRFALVLCGGGGAGLAHAGILKAFEHYGYKPSALIGVSMGAVVAATYALNRNWYRDLLDADTTRFPSSPSAADDKFRARVRSLLSSEKALQDMLFGWGAGSKAASTVRKLLSVLTRKGKLEDGRVPVAVVATDLCSGNRVVLRVGSAADAVYASTALAGIFPPLPADGRMLADGGYADMAPVDVARAFGVETVIAAYPEQSEWPAKISTGFQAMLRAMQICSAEHTRLRLQLADLVIKPRFPVPVDVLDFDHKRLCVAAGARAVRRAAGEIQRLLLQ